MCSAIGRRQIFSSIIGPLLCCLASACGQSISSGFDRAVDFSAYKTFCRVRVVAQDTDSGTSISAAIASGLKAKGLSEGTAGCDLIVVGHEKVAQRRETWTTDVAGGAPTAIYFGPNAPGDVSTTTQLSWNGWGNGLTTESTRKLKGIELQLDVIDAIQRKLIYRGLAFVKTSSCRSAAVGIGKCESRDKDAVLRAVTKLLKKYP